MKSATVWSFVFAVALAVHADGLTRSIALYVPPGMADSLLFGDTVSMHHSLAVAGVPWQQCGNLDSACRSAVVVCPAKWTDQGLTQAQLDSLQAYVGGGGVLVGFWVRNAEAMPLFGVQSGAYSSRRYRIEWDTAAHDAALQWIDDPHEQIIRLGDSSKTEIFGTLGYAPGVSATALARFDDGSAAVVAHATGAGCTYALGFTARNIIAVNQIHWGYGASIAYSNDFEPTSDVFMLFFRGIYQKHIRHAVWKHTTPGGKAAALMVTHDVDSRSSVDTMAAFAQMEASRGVRAHYFVTTHHYRDPPRIGALYDDRAIAECRSAIALGHSIGSHSVGHFPDFGTSHFPVGAPGNTRENYRPLCPVDSTSGGTVYGELEVSRAILEEDLGTRVRSFRSGHMAWPAALPEVMQKTGYLFNSSRSACDVLTNFPFFMQKGTTILGKRLRVLEIPMTISDVLKEETFDSTTYVQAVQVWGDVLRRNADNGAPTVLLIHPNRMVKVAAEQLLLDATNTDIETLGFDEFGAFWNDRSVCVFSDKLAGDSTLTIRLHSAINPATRLCFACDGVPMGGTVKVRDASGAILETQQAQWRNMTLISLGHRLPIRNAGRPRQQRMEIQIRGGRMWLSGLPAHKTPVDIRLYNLQGVLVYHAAAIDPTIPQILDTRHLPAEVFVATIRLDNQYMRMTVNSHR
ncbi:MAG: hypothetical protein GX556_04890 [Fibrobacter sp.]|nr:hypothetical protein [Fibrobacter sp.]